MKGKEETVLQLDDSAVDIIKEILSEHKQVRSLVVGIANGNKVDLSTHRVWIEFGGVTVHFQPQPVTDKTKTEN